jgi:hypothetical protein
MAVNTNGVTPTTTAPAAGKKPNRDRHQRAQGDLDAACDFLFLVHPQRYDVYEVGKAEDGTPLFEVLPAPTTLEFQPGLAGVEPVKDEQNGNYLVALAKKREKGWIDVPMDFPVTAFGVKQEGYVHVFSGKHGPDTVHLEVWRRPYKVGGTVFFERDGDGYIQFLRDIKEKILPPIDPNVLRGLKAKLQGMRQTAAGAAAKGHVGGEHTVGLLEQKLTAFSGAESARGAAGKKPARKAPETPTQVS